MAKTATALLVALALTVSLGSGCTRRQERQLRRVWRDSGGQYYQRVNLNTASREEISRLPGLTDDDADRIIRNRPYGNKKKLLTKGILGPKKYEDIEDFVYVD